MVLCPFVQMKKSRCLQYISIIVYVSNSEKQDNLLARKMNFYCKKWSCFSKSIVYILMLLVLNIGFFYIQH